MDARILAALKAAVQAAEEILRRGDPAEALRAYEAIVVALEAAVQAAENLLRRGDLAGAFQAYEAILFTRLAAGGGTARLVKLAAADLVVIERLAELAVLFGHSQAAEHLLEGMTRLNQEAGNQYGADYTILKRIHLALGYGQLRHAHTLLEAMRPSIGQLEAIQFSPAGLERWEAERYWPDTDRADRAVLLSRLYHMMGRMLAAHGRYSSALAALERGLAHTGKAAPDLAQQMDVHLRLAIAAALIERGDLPAADTRLAALEGDIDAVRRPGLAIHRMELCGKIALLRGEFGRALELFTEVSQICGERGFQFASLTAALNLAHVLIFLNQTSAAGRLLGSIKAQAQALDAAAPAARADYLLHLAYARATSLAPGVSIAPSVSELHGAVEDSAPSSEIQDPPLDRHQADNFLTLYEDRALGLQWKLAHGDMRATRQLLAQLQTTFHDTDSRLIQLRLRTMAGVLAYYQGDIRRSAVMLNELCPALRAFGLKPELWQAQRVLSWCWLRLGRPDAEQLALAADTKELLDSMTHSLNGADQTIFLLNKWTADEEYIVAEIDQLLRMKAALAESPRAVRPWRRWAMWRRLDRLLWHIDRYKNTRAKETVGGAAQPAQARRRPLWLRLLAYPRDRAMLSFLVLPDRVLVTRMSQRSLDFDISWTTRIQVRDTVRQWHESIGDINRRSRQADAGAEHTNGSPAPITNGTLATGDRAVFPLDDDTRPAHVVDIESAKKYAEQLATSLLIPNMLKMLPQGIRALTIVPEDSLHGFPFATLTYEGQYLAERYAISLAFESSSDHTPARRHGPLTALAVGVTRGTQHMRPLTGVRPELDLVEVWLNQRGFTVQRLLDDTASRAAVLEQLPQAALLHIACHGIFKHNQPDQSGLVLIPKAGQEEMLSLRELSTLRLNDVQHITLSSCWSADHFILPGRWVIGLPETLWRSGARSILGCLWEVNDRLAAAFMNRFYIYLDHLPRDEALRQTQLDCIARRLPDCDDIDTSHPMYWAGFNLYGASSYFGLGQIHRRDQRQMATDEGLARSLSQ